MIQNMKLYKKPICKVFHINSEELLTGSQENPTINSDATWNGAACSKHINFSSEEDDDFFSFDINAN